MTRRQPLAADKDGVVSRTRSRARTFRSAGRPPTGRPPFPPHPSPVQGRGLQVPPDGGMQGVVADGGPGPASCGRSRWHGACHPSGVEARAGHVPEPADVLDAAGLAGAGGDRPDHRRDHLRAAGPGRSRRVRSSSFSMPSSPIRWSAAAGPGPSVAGSRAFRVPSRAAPARAPRLQLANRDPDLPRDERQGLARHRPKHHRTPGATLQRWPASSGPTPAASWPVDGPDGRRPPTPPLRPILHIIPLALLISRHSGSIHLRSSLDKWMSKETGASSA
jgi:hypothetical protein